MPRRLLKKYTPHPHLLRERWFIRLFGTWLAHPALWSLQRRSVTGAFGAGLAVCFVPLPIHLPLAALVVRTLRRPEWSAAARVHLSALTVSIALFGISLWYWNLLGIRH